MDDKIISVTAAPVEPSISPKALSDEVDLRKNRSKHHDLHTIGGGAKYGPMDKLDRYLSSKPIISFGLTLQASWEAVAISFQSTLLNGGPSTLVYGSILSIFGSASMAASLGELASV